jgi:hypothetical protein
VVATRWLLLASLTACTQPSGELYVPDRDPIEFRDAVYPVLMRDCAFPACHGTPDRFFAVYGPGRTRLDPTTGIYDPPTSTEIALAFSRAESMLLSPEGPEASLFLRKPIPRSQGGAGHRGDDPFGTPVYRTTDDARYAALYHWGVE